MKRSDFLAIIGALPFFRKKVQKKIPERYLAAQRAMQFDGKFGKLSPFIDTWPIQKQPRLTIVKSSHFSVLFCIFLISPCYENPSIETNAPIRNTLTLSRLLISFWLALKLKSAKLVELSKIELIGGSDFNRIVSTNSFSYFSQSSTKYPDRQTVGLLSKIFLIGVCKIRLFSKNAIFKLKTHTFLAKTVVILIEIFRIIRLTNFSSILTELLPFRNKTSYQTCPNRNKPTSYKFQNLVRTTISQDLYYDSNLPELTSAFFLSATEINRFNRILEFIKPPYRNGFLAEEFQR